MLRIRFLIVLALGFLATSAAWADEVGYVDCSNHSDATQVFGKPRRSPDVVASLACGERFTILVYGFYFSRIQTKDGQIGYIYSSLIAVDRGAAAAQPTTSLQVATEKTKIPSTRYTEPAVTPATAQPQPTPHQQAPAVSAGFPTPASVSSASPAPASAVADTSASPDPAASATQAALAAATTATPAEPAAAAPVTAAPAPAEVQPTPKPEITPSTSASNPPEVSAPAAQPDPATPTAQPDQPAPAPAAEPAAAQPNPEPAPAQPAPIKPAIRPADTHETWEKPNPSVRTPPLLEFFGGFAFNRMGSGAGYSSTNFNGALGSFAYNFKPWLQLVGDTSYNFVTVSGTKTILYGNHYGPRYYYRGLSRLHITPFAEAFIGGSRADTTYAGSTTSQNCISYKVGGGIDYRASRRWEIRLFDFDYYRTSFGTNAHQTNYWASTGIVLRLFGGGSE